MYKAKCFYNDNLQDRVNQELKNSLYKNKYFKKYKWPLYKQAICWSGEHIIKSLTLLILIISVITLFITYFESFFERTFNVNINNIEIINNSVQLAAGIQATILGVVFPLVVSFIGFLIKDRSASKPLWSVYKSVSGLMFLGSSSLAFLFSFMVVNLFGTILSAYTLSSLNLALSFWFLLNLYMTGYFLWQTMVFLLPSQQMNMVVSYAISFVIEEDIKTRLSSFISNSANHELINAIPGNVQGVKIQVHDYNYKKSDETFEIDLKEDSVLVGVRYWLLRFFLNSYIDRCINKKDKMPTKISFPCVVNGFKNNQFSLINTNGNELSWFDKKILLACFKFKTNAVDTMLSIGDITDLLFGQIEGALKDSNSRHFKEAVGELIDFNKRIESSMYFYDEDTELHDNLLLLKDSNFFGNTFSEQFSAETSHIGHLVALRVDHDPSFFESWCYVYPKIYSRNNIHRPSKLIFDYLQAHYQAWGALMSSFGGSEPDEHKVIRHRDTSVKYFIGSWEHWYTLFNRNNIHGDVGIDDSLFKCLEAHLQHSCCMVVVASQNQNWEAMAWAVDVVLASYGRVQNFRSSYPEMLWHHPVFTSGLIYSLEDSSFKNKAYNGEKVVSIEASNIAFKNTWIDMRFTIAGYLMQSSQYLEKLDYKNAIKSLLDEDRHIGSGSLVKSKTKICSNIELLGSFLRINGTWKKEFRNKDLIEATLERLDRIEQPTWISGRTYNWSVNLGDSLLTFYKAALVSCTKGEFKLTNDWFEFIKSNALELNERQNLSDKLRALAVDLESVREYALYQFELSEDQFTTQSEYLVKSLNSICDELSKENSKQIILADKDPQKLNLIAGYASKTLLNPADFPIPLCFFKSSNHILATELSSLIKTFFIKDYRKSDIALDIEVQRVANEEEWFSNMITQRAILEVISQLDLFMNWQSFNFDDAKKTLIKAVQLGARMSKDRLTPLLLIGEWTLFRIIDESRWTRSKTTEKLPFEITVSKNQPERYVCHIGEVAVYKLPNVNIPYSLLIPEEAFLDLEFAEFDNKTLVDVDFIEKDNNPLGDLSLSFAIKSNFKNMDCFKFKTNTEINKN